MKKLMSLLMAGVMILALAVPAFAADPYAQYDDESDQLTQSTTFNARTFVPTVKLSMPKLEDNPIVLNPYKIAYDASVVDENTLNGVEVGDSDDQIKQVISPIYSIKNETDVKLNFAISATTTLSGEVTISADPVKVDETNKKAHLSLVVKRTEGLTADIPDSDTAQTFGLNTTTGAFDTDKYEFIPLKAGEAKSSTAISKSLMPPTALSPAATEDYLLFQFQGDLTRKPTKAWTADDKVSVIVTFTFTPESQHDFTATHDDSSNAIAKEDTGITTPKTIQLAVGDTTAAAFASTVAPASATYHATPDWAVVSSGGLGTLTVNASNQLVVSTDAQKLVPADGTNHDYKIVLSYKDINSIPRTLELTLTLKRSNT